MHCENLPTPHRDLGATVLLAPEPSETFQSSIGFLLADSGEPHYDLTTMTLLAGIFDFLTSEAMVDSMKWALIVALIVIGFFGTFLPILPGTTLMFAGFVLHYFLFGMEESRLTWQGLVVITLLYIASLVLDWISGAIGAKWFGSSKYGVIGAIVGGIIGLFFSLPGLIIGPIIGVFAFEMIFAKKEVKEASNSTVGTVVGGIAGVFAKVLLALGMAGWYVVDVFLMN